jgi:hypothetical protein
MDKVQFSDSHGHRWHFVRVYKRDRYGRMVTDNEQVVAENDPDKFKKGVHLKDIHLEKGMQCIDCHAAQDAHGGGDGKLYTQMRDVIAIRCWDCHGTPAKIASSMAGSPSGVPGILMNTLRRSAFACSSCAQRNVVFVSRASSGDTSSETQPSTPAVRS